MYSVRGTVRAGSQAPPIKARDIRGVVFDMAGYAGRSNLVIFFYRNSRCHTCRDELKDMAGKYGHIARQDGEVVAISNDGFDEAKNLAVDLRLPFRVISDPGGEIIKSYGVYDKNTDTAYPTVFIVDKDAVVRFVRQVQGMDDLLPADEIVNKLRDLG
jgi:peroxiredoxin Q/BCP